LADRAAAAAGVSAITPRHVQLNPAGSSVKYVLNVICQRSGGASSEIA
jgi:hypothetical protein